MKKYLLLLAISGLVICIDQITKIYIFANFSEGESVNVISNFFNITYVKNPGAAFGFLRDAHEGFREIFFLLIAPIAAVIILFMMKSVDDKDRVSIFALSSLFGGALGNYIDRLWHGYVVDFLDFHYYQKASWPAFNVADAAIVCGIGLMLLMEFKQGQKQKKKT